MCIGILHVLAGVIWFILKTGLCDLVDGTLWYACTGVRWKLGASLAQNPESTSGDCVPMWIMYQYIFPNGIKYVPGWLIIWGA